MKKQSRKIRRFSGFANIKIIIPLMLSERTLCAETILNRFLQDHIFDEQRNAAVIAVQKLYFIF